MTTFSRTWNATYEAIPEDDDDALEGASHIRNTRIDVAERMEVDHFWAGDAHDGKHKKITFKRQATDPALDPDDIALYGKAVGTKTELFYRNQDGQVVQMTFSGQSQFLPAGVVIPFAGSVVPGGFVLCHGQTLSRTTYPALFGAIGTAFGAGDGSTTFGIPDIRGRVIAGKDNMGGAAAGRLTEGISGSTLGATGGNDTHTLTIAQMPGHGHTVNDPGHAHSYNAPAGANGAFGGTAGTSTPSSTGAAATGITLSNTGGGGSHPNVQPTMILNYIIKT